MRPWTKLARRVRFAARNPSAISAYGRWLVASDQSGVSVTVPGGRVSDFISFSEYWSVLRYSPGVREARLISRFARQGAVMLDVGAHLGTFTVIMSRAIPDGQVHAFEPSLQTYLRLCSTITANHLHNASLHALALSCDEGTVPFLMDQSSPATHRLSAGRAGATATPVHVSATSLDHFCRQHDIPEIDFVKLDVEGAEVAVLQGAAHMLGSGRVRGLLLEVCPNNLHEAGTSVDELFTCLRSYGYVCYHVGPNGQPGAQATLRDLRSVPLWEDVLALPASGDGSRP